MIAFAKHEFKFGRVLPDGASLGDHVKSGLRQFEVLGIKPNIPLVDNAPEFPEELRYLWSWFADITYGIASSGFGPAMITWRDLAAWSALTATQIEPFEARALLRLGTERAIVASEDKRDGQDKS